MNPLFPSPEVVARVGQCLLPLMREEVVFRTAGEYPVFKAFWSGFGMGVFGLVGTSAMTLYREAPAATLRAVGPPRGH